MSALSSILKGEDSTSKPACFRGTTGRCFAVRVGRHSREKVVGRASRARTRSLGIARFCKRSHADDCAVQGVGSKFGNVAAARGSAPTLLAPSKYQKKNYDQVQSTAWEFGQGGRPRTERTGANERRCAGEAPSLLSAAKCSRTE